jgi:hypothetical protein
LIERLSEKLDLVSGQSINARNLLEAKLRAPRPTKDENNTTQGGQTQGALSNGNNDDDDDEEELAALFVDHTFYASTATRS